MPKKIKTQNIEAIKPADFERIKVDKTQHIVFETSKDLDSIKKELSALSRKELIYRLNFEETDPKVIKMIKDLLQDK